MKATEKTDTINNFLDYMTGSSRKENISRGVCIPAPIGCGGPAKEFSNERSRREYSIGGLCQKCQDSIFGGVVMDIREVVNQYWAIQADLKQWIKNELDPLLLECESSDDVSELKRQTGYQFGGDDSDYRLPSIVTVHFAIYSCRFIEKEEKERDPLGVDRIK